MPKTNKCILVNVVLIFLFLGILELFIFVTLKYPAIHKVLPNIFAKIARRIYSPYDMNIIQYSPDCARYDPYLGYTLKPGKFVFSNYEFTTTYTVNSLGVRDTEEALNSPQVVVLGDSYAMGWGVKQNETFAKIIEAGTGLSVLNASVSSYGTAREMMLLKKIKRDRLQYLIIQYCINDYEENVNFLNNGNKLVAMSREKYAESVRQSREIKKYYPGKYLWCAANIISNNFNYFFNIGDYKKTVAKRHTPKNDAPKVFIDVILNSGIDLSGVQLIVFSAEINPIQVNFENSLGEKVSSGKYPPFIKDMIILDASKCLNQDRDLLLVDGHYNRGGHRLVAEMIMQQMVSR